MKFLSKSMVLGCTLFAFGCVDSDPEYKAEKARQRAEHSQQSTQLAKAEFSPLMPICLNKLERGIATSPAQMAKLGFKQKQVTLATRESYIKARGTSTADRVKNTNTTLRLYNDRCSFGLNNYPGLHEGGAVLRELLRANGYKYKGNIGGVQDVFTKNGFELALSGGSYSGATNYVVVKAK
ncbi:hypothetical protein MWU76_21105 [Gelidibacter sp. F2691]|nr:hypothetical protein [Gelidibacter sp. F2691]